MENAYSTAMKIADAISKRRLLESLADTSGKKKYKDKTWQEIEKETSSEKLEIIKKGHQIIFEEAHTILQSA